MAVPIGGPEPERARGVPPRVDVLRGDTGASRQAGLSYAECRRLGLPTCKGTREGIECPAALCPQRRDGEPERTGRACPFLWDRSRDEDDAWKPLR